MGFTNAKYRSQEAGSRPISLEDAEQYATAFGISLEALTDPDLRDLDRKLSMVGAIEAEEREAAKNANQAVARRLKTARLARGFDSARQAAKMFSLTIPTYLGHEAAKSSLAAPSARLYAAAFGINDAWLLHGDLPSGLGLKLDVRLESLKHLDDVVHLRHLVSPFRPPAKSRLTTLKASLASHQASKWAANSDVVREIDPSDLRQLGLDALHIKPNRFWPLPKGFVRSAFNASANDVVVIVWEAPVERLFVDVSRTKLDSYGQFLVLHSNGLLQLDMRSGLSELPEGAIIIGLIQARFTLLK